MCCTRKNCNIYHASSSVAGCKFDESTPGFCVQLSANHSPPRDPAGANIVRPSQNIPLFGHKEHSQIRHAEMPTWYA